ncbi:MAG: PD40 domain-containing protein [Armatimonadetes bacterium]|nr:PD40 domain-containing protein [Armatimonadota bacterium]
MRSRPALLSLLLAAVLVPVAGSRAVEPASYVRRATARESLQASLAAAGNTRDVIQRRRILEKLAQDFGREAVGELEIEQDWLFQTNYQVTPASVRQEIEWAQQVASRLPAGVGAAQRAELAALRDGLNADNIEATYFAVRRAKRALLFADPAVDFKSVVLTDNPFPNNSFGHNAHESGHRNQYGTTNAGGRLLVLDGLHPGAPLRDLAPGFDGVFWRPDLSYDGRRVVFCYLPKDGPSYNLYEVGVDGQGPRRLTNSPYDDLDPIYLPDGNLMFSTTRGNTYIRCLPQSRAFVMARCDANGKNIYLVSQGNEPDYLPSMMPDGRVIYTRWEYTERPLWRVQSLWTARPDGTGHAAYWGNSSVYPDLLWEPRAVPGTDLIMCTCAGHHSVFNGCLTLINVNEGRNHPDGVHKITSDVAWPEVGDSNDPVDKRSFSPRYHRTGDFTAYMAPYPLSPNLFLVSARTGPQTGGNSLQQDPEVVRYGLYLMDIDGNKELIYRGRHNAWYAQPLRPRAKPPTLASTVAWAKPDEQAQPGTFFSSNVYQGAAGLKPGSAKWLRVLQMDAKTYSMGFKSLRHSGPAVSILQEDGVKRILGTTPVEPDGSVNFEVPAGKALHFQLLDEQGRCIQIMRSFTGVQPGEKRGCVGCHEMHNTAPTPPRTMPAAMRRAALPLTEPSWGAGTSVSFERFCQPVLDRNCGLCHADNGRATPVLDLTLRSGVNEGGISEANLLPYKQPYLTLVGDAWGYPSRLADGEAAPQRGQPGYGMAGPICVEGTGGDTMGGLRTLRPYTMLSSASPLIALAMSGTHYGVKVEGEDLQRLIAWVDCNCVYRGDEEIRQIPDPPRPPGWAVPPLVQSAPVIDRTKPIDYVPAASAVAAATDARP